MTDIVCTVARSGVVALPMRTLPPVEVMPLAKVIAVAPPSDTVKLVASSATVGLSGVAPASWACSTVRM